MRAGQTLTVVMETDWRAPQIQADFAITAWGEGSKVNITHVGGVESDHYPLQGVSRDSGPKPDEEEKADPDDEEEKADPDDEEEKTDPEDEFDFEKFTDDASTPLNWCDAGIQVMDTENEGRRAIRVSHTCEGYSLNVAIGMKSS